MKKIFVASIAVLLLSGCFANDSKESNVTINEDVQVAAENDTKETMPKSEGSSTSEKPSDHSNETNAETFNGRFAGGTANILEMTENAITVDFNGEKILFDLDSSMKEKVKEFSVGDKVTVSFQENEGKRKLFGIEAFKMTFTPSESFEGTASVTLPGTINEITDTTITIDSESYSITDSFKKVTKTRNLKVGDKVNYTVQTSGDKKELLNAIVPGKEKTFSSEATVKKIDFFDLILTLPNGEDIVLDPSFDQDEEIEKKGIKEGDKVFVSYKETASDDFDLVSISKK